MALGGIQAMVSCHEYGVSHHDYLQLIEQQNGILIIIQLYANNEFKSVSASKDVIRNQGCRPVG